MVAILYFAFVITLISLSRVANAQPTISPSGQPTGQTLSYTYTGNEEYVTVPSDVTGITVTACGGNGGAGSSGTEVVTFGGTGGCIQADVTVTPGEVLTIVVAADGATSVPNNNFGAGGYYGGGDGSSNSGYHSGGGGGASYVQSSDGTVLIAAGGGGGSGCKLYMWNVYVVWYQ